MKGLETCVTIDEGFQTSDVPGLKDGSDVFIGFGEKMSYGKFKNLEFDGSSCEPVENYRLIYAPIVGSQTPFSFTLDGIKNEIVNNQLIVDNLSKTLRQRNDAQYQINAWNRIIQLNEDNKNNPANVPKYPPQNFSAGLMKTLSTTISVANTSSLTLESYIENENELKGVAEVNGNGINSSYKITNKKRFGATNSATSSTDDMIKITLKDDDLGDKFDMDIVGDAMFGTPVFRLKDIGTKSSCPFEGGYKRDQPSISQPFYAPTSCESGDKQTISNVGNLAEGQSFSWPINICNNSNESRTYRIYLIQNRDNATIKLKGADLGLTNSFVTYTVPPNDCVKENGLRPKLLISPSVDKNITIYRDIKLFITPDCTDTKAEDYDQFPEQILTINFEVGTRTLADDDCDGMLNGVDNCPTLPTSGINFDGVDDQVEIW